MDKHRKMRDGSIRDSDNWQKGFGNAIDHYKTCIKSLFRHFMDVWFIHRRALYNNMGLKAYGAEDEMEESLCAIIFNASAYLHKLREQRIGDKTDLVKECIENLLGKGKK